MKTCPNCKVSTVKVDMLMSSFMGCPICKEDVDRIVSHDVTKEISPAPTKLQSLNGYFKVFLEEFQVGDRIEIIALNVLGPNQNLSVGNRYEVAGNFDGAGKELIDKFITIEHPDGWPCPIKGIGKYWAIPKNSIKKVS